MDLTPIRAFAFRMFDGFDGMENGLRFDIPRRASLRLRLLTLPMTELEKLRAVLTDSHFLIPVIVFAVGLALLITLH